MPTHYSQRIELSHRTQELLSALSQDDAKLLASLHNAPPELAAATLELCPFHLRSTLEAYGVLERHPEKPHLLWISRTGWDCVDELAMLWSEDDLVAHFQEQQATQHRHAATCG